MMRPRPSMTATTARPRPSTTAEGASLGVVLGAAATLEIHIVFTRRRSVVAVGVSSTTSSSHHAPDTGCVFISCCLLDNIHQSPGLIKLATAFLICICTCTDIPLGHCWSPATATRRIQIYSAMAMKGKSLLTHLFGYTHTCLVPGLNMSLKCITEI